MKKLGIGLLVVLVIAVVYIALFGLSFASIRLGGILRQEEARVDREVFEESLSYQRGNVEHLERLMLEYQTADTDGHRTILRRTILETYASVDIDDLPEHQQAFIRRLREGG